MMWMCKRKGVIDWICSLTGTGPKTSIGSRWVNMVNRNQTGCGAEVGEMTKKSLTATSVYRGEIWPGVGLLLPCSAIILASSWLRIGLRSRINHVGVLKPRYPTYIINVLGSSIYPRFRDGIPGSRSD